MLQESLCRQLLRIGIQFKLFICICILSFIFLILKIPKHTQYPFAIRMRYSVNNYSTKIQNFFPTSRDTVTGNATLLSSQLPSNTPSIKEYYAICMESGRLGNNMFTYASVYGIAKRRGLTVVIEDSNPLLTYFKLDAKRVKIKDMHGYIKLKERRSCDFDEDLTTFAPKRDIYFERYLQSWKYFFHVEDLIHKQFEFSTGTKMAADKVISEMRDKYSKSKNASVTVIGIHFRRGDMIEKHFNDFGYQPASVEYVQRAVKYFRLFHDHVIFLLASNSKEYIQNLLKDEDVVFLEQNSVIVDMAIMARCDHLILTVGTYGWWAGFMNKGTVLYYKYPARKGSPLRAEYGASYQNYFYPNWIGLP